MTILTKPSNEKKSEKILPLGVVNEDGTLLNSAPSAPSISFYHNGDSESMVYERSRLSAIKVALLFLGSLLVMLMGILGGYTMYRLYAPLHGNLHFHGMCDIPYYPKNGSAVAHLHARPDMFQLTELRNLFPQLNNNSALFDDDDDDDFFHEEIELDLAEEDQYAKIDVPDFKDGRRGRFMHDFKENQSAIIDTSANRCFIMPLDRDTTLPPKSFMDLMEKMRTGYYNIDTNRVRRNMRVVTPELTDLSLISKRIGNECYDMRVYLLEKFISGVFKREAVELSDDGKFGVFTGKGIVLYNIQNINDLEKYEQLHKK